MYSLAIKRTQLVECVLNTVAVGQRFQFQDVPEISRNNIVLYGIEAFTATQLVTSPDARTVVPIGTGLVVNLKNALNEEFVYNIPYFSLIRSQNGGFFFSFAEGIDIQLTNCTVQITNNTSLVANQAAVFNLVYAYRR
jgi:hypothetical protein